MSHESPVQLHVSDSKAVPSPLEAAEQKIRQLKAALAPREEVKAAVEQYIALQAAVPPAPRVCRFGICGTAEITGKVAPALIAASNSKVVAIGSRSIDKAREWAKQHCPEARACSYEDLLRDPNIDAVYVPLPSGLRNDFILKAAKAGKAVYSEKPMAGTYKEVMSTIDACAANNVQWMDGTMWVHSTRTQEIHKRIKSGAIGPIKHIVAAFTFSAPDEKWLQGGNVRTDRTREPLGCFGDEGWYPIQAIMFGYDYELPLRVMMTSTVLNQKDTIIFCTGFLWFSNGRTASFDAGAVAPHRSQVEFVGETGLVRLDDLVGGQGRTGMTAYFEPYVGSGQFIQSDKEGKDQVVKVEPCDHVIKLVEAFSSCVLSGHVDEQWPRRTKAVHTVMAALFESAQKNGAIVDMQEFRMRT